jgi:hypothetical protein
MFTERDCAQTRDSLNKPRAKAEEANYPIRLVHCD